MSNDGKTSYSNNKANPYAVFLQKPFLIVDNSEFICGWGAAFINITVTYPIYKIIFRQVGSYHTTYNIIYTSIARK